MKHIIFAACFVSITGLAACTDSMTQGFVNDAGVPVGEKIVDEQGAHTGYRIRDGRFCNPGDSAQASCVIVDLDARSIRIIGHPPVRIPSSIDVSKGFVTREEADILSNLLQASLKSTSGGGSDGGSDGAE